MSRIRRISAPKIASQTPIRSGGKVTYSLQRSPGGDLIPPLRPTLWVRRKMRRLGLLLLAFSGLLSGCREPMPPIWGERQVPKPTFRPVTTAEAQPDLKN